MSSRYYSDSWKVSIAPFEQAVFCFKKLVSNYKLPSADMDSATQQAITDLTERQDAIYVKLDEKFKSMRLMFEALMESRPAASPKPKLSQHQSPSLSPDLTSEYQPCMERWNQADLSYFDPHLDEKAHRPGKVVSMGKDVYYRNVVLFV